MERNFPVITWTREFWKIRPFDYIQHIILIMYTNARFHSTGTTFLRPNFPKIILMRKTFVKINNKIVISI